MSIAILGMVLGWGSVLSIGVYVYDELSYDHFHEKGERIYRVTHNETAGEIAGTRHLATVGPPMGPALQSQFKQVEDFVRFRYHPHVISERATFNIMSSTFFSQIVRSSTFSVLK